MKIIINRPGKWRGSKMRPSKPIRIKGYEWNTGTGGTVTVFDKNGLAILSLGEGEWTRVRRG
jgi:hypothetical protein